MARDHSTSYFILLFVNPGTKFNCTDIKGVCTDLFFHTLLCQGTYVTVLSYNFPIVSGELHADSHEMWQKTVEVIQKLENKKYSYVQVAFISIRIQRFWINVNIKL